MASKLRVLRLISDAKLPVRADGGSAGYDLFSNVSVTINPGERVMVKTGIALTVPYGTYGRIASRSSMALKYMDVCGGVIDRSYTGEIKVILHNHGTSVYKIRKDDKIAQLVIECIGTPDVFEMEELKKTKRGNGGFGSTGR